MSILIIVSYLCFIVIPFISARPHQHSGYHKLNHHLRHHVHQHLAHRSGPGSAAQIPLTELEVDPLNDASAQDKSSPGVMITVSFNSIPRWPKSGEQVDFLVLPLNRWFTPEDVSSLPRRPHKAHIVAAKVQEEAGQPSKAYQHDDRVVCHIIVAGLEPEEVSMKSESSSRILSFRLADGEVNLEDPVAPWYLGGRTVERFGCF